MAKHKLVYTEKDSPEFAILIADIAENAPPKIIKKLLTKIINHVEVNEDGNITYFYVKALEEEVEIRYEN